MTSTDMQYQAKRGERMSDLEARAIALRGLLKSALAEARAISAEIAECSPRAFDVQNLEAYLKQAHGSSVSLVANINHKRDHLVTIWCFDGRGKTPRQEVMTPVEEASQ